MPNWVKVVLDDMLNQAIPPRTAAMVAAHIVLVLRKLKAKAKLTFVGMKSWPYHFDSSHYPGMEANYHVGYLGYAG